MSQDFCFCTLAVGKRYRNHARMLARDIQANASGIPLVILTDRTDEFEQNSNVLAFPHRLQSVRGFHDKRFVLARSLELFESCMFLDSDVRVIGPVPGDMEWLPGITARAGCCLLKHMKKFQKSPEIPVIEKAALNLGIDLQTVQWLHEFMFTMRRNNGLEVDFFNNWKAISYFFEMQGIYYGEGYSMGLAAAKVGLVIQFFREDKFPFFKDNIEFTRIKKGQSNLDSKREYWDSHREIENLDRRIWNKVIDKITGKATLFYRLLRLRKWMWKDPDFQKLFKEN